MPLQPQNFMQLGIQKPDWSNVSNALGNYYKGFELAQTPQKLAAERLAEQLRNSILGTEEKYADPLAQQNLQYQKLQNQYYGPEKEAHIKQMIAQAEHYKDQAAGRTFAPSALGKLIQERNDLAAQDPNDPRLADYDRLIKAQGGSKFAPTGLGKLHTELQEVEAGFLPGSNGTIPLNAVEQEELRKRYKLQIQKTSTDSTTRTTALRGQNLLKSIDASNIDALTRYSGPAGAASLLKEKAMDMAGKPSKEYLEHLEALQAAKLEAKELRQFFGDSITPSVQDAIYEMVNATSLTKSPEAAKRMIQKSRDTIKKQIKTFEDALRTTEAFSEQSIDPNDEVQQVSQALQNGINNNGEKMVVVKYKGKQKIIPANKLQEALKAGGIFVGAYNGG